MAVDSATTIYMVRHGQTDYNKARMFQGSTDVPLNEVGLAQAELARKAFEDIHLDVAYSSPLKRALVTCETIVSGRGITPVVHEDFREQNAGVWEGHTISEIEEKYPVELDNWYNRPSISKIPGGETFHEVKERAVRALTEVADENEGKSILITSHMVCLSTIMNAAAGLDLDQLFDYPISNAGICILEYKDGKFSVKEHNRDDHLPDEYKAYKKKDIGK